MDFNVKRADYDGEMVPIAVSIRLDMEEATALYMAWVMNQISPVNPFFRGLEKVVESLEEPSLSSKDVWPDSDADGLREYVRSQWPQLADALDEESGLS